MCSREFSGTICGLSLPRHSQTKKHDDRPNGTNGNASRKNDTENFEFVKSHLCKFDSQLNADFVA